MIVTKVTVGFVTQRYDTEKKQFLDQEFYASDDVNWENEMGESVDAPQNDNGDEPYLNFEMIQPAKHNFKNGDKVVATPDIDDDFHEFKGTVVGFRDNGNLITVKDQEDNCFDCRPGQLKHA